MFVDYLTKKSFLKKRSLNNWRFSFYYLNYNICSKQMRGKHIALFLKFDLIFLSIYLFSIRLFVNSNNQNEPQKFVFPSFHNKTSIRTVFMQSKQLSINTEKLPKHSNVSLFFPFVCLLLSGLFCYVFVGTIFLLLLCYYHCENTAERRTKTQRTRRLCMYMCMHFTKYIDIVQYARGKNVHSVSDTVTLIEKYYDTECKHTYT